MTFENFARLTGAKLLNEPSIYSFKKIETNPKKVKIGDLFIGDCAEDIELALKLEAYGILSTKKLEIVDKEIAWFEATSLEDILIRLLRFTLLEKNLRFVYLPIVELKLIKNIADKENLIFLDTDDKESYKKIINADEKIIIFGANEDFLRQIYPEFETIKSSKSLFIRDDKSLFLSNFIYKRQIFSDIKISPFLLEHLENVLTFLEQNSIDYEIEKCDYNSHFHPVFVTKKLHIKPFGKSEQVIICQCDKSQLKKSKEFIKTKAPWAKAVYVEFANLESLKNIEFNFAIIATDYDKLITKLEQNQTKAQVMLF